MDSIHLHTFSYPFHPECGNGLIVFKGWSLGSAIEIVPRIHSLIFGKDRRGELFGFVFQFSVFFVDARNKARKQEGGKQEERNEGSKGFI